MYRGGRSRSPPQRHRWLVDPRQHLVPVTHGDGDVTSSSSWSRSRWAANILRAWCRLVRPEKLLEIVMRKRELMGEEPEDFIGSDSDISSTVIVDIEESDVARM
jgi:hypothetical protein